MTTETMTLAKEEPATYACPEWVGESVFYHIYPLGLCGAPHYNDPHRKATSRLKKVHYWIEHMRYLGCNALWIGPLFESLHHGYDTIDYRILDRRLGQQKDLKALIDACHAKGITVVLDAVLNHVGRRFPYFLDLKKNLEKSEYKDWFAGVNFKKKSPQGDPFSYKGWKGHYDLVQWNQKNEKVKDYIKTCIAGWMDLGIDGLRIDAADCMDKDFLAELQAFCKAKDPNFWLMAEVVMGDYNDWNMLDGVTNYEFYDALHKSHTKKDYFYLEKSLNRQYGPHGVYTKTLHYNFADNHDVDRIASTVKDIHRLRPLYAALYTAPGVPSLYYGSEFGLKGTKQKYSDAQLRPAFDHPVNSQRKGEYRDLAETLKKLAQLRKQLPALQRGTYKTLSVTEDTLLFERSLDETTVLIALNRSKESQTIPLEAGRYFSHWQNQVLKVKTEGLKLLPYGINILQKEAVPLLDMIENHNE